jgi:hypothetical protein
MKKLSNVFIKISNFFIDDLSPWIENDLENFSRKIGVKFFRLAEKLYPNNFCHYCGALLDRCYNPPLKDPPQYFCCNCQRTIHEEEYK